MLVDEVGEGAMLANAMGGGSGASGGSSSSGSAARIRRAASSASSTSSAASEGIRSHTVVSIKYCNPMQFPEYCRSALCLQALDRRNASRARCRRTSGRNGALADADASCPPRPRRLLEDRRRAVCRPTTRRTTDCPSRPRRCPLMRRPAEHRTRRVPGVSKRLCMQA